jgi:hypothetical protein
MSVFSVFSDGNGYTEVEEKKELGIEDEDVDELVAVQVLPSGEEIVYPDGGRDVSTE